MSLPAAARRRPRARLGLAVLMGHVALVGALWQGVRTAGPDQASAAPSMVWLRGSIVDAPAAADPAAAEPLPSTRRGRLARAARAAAIAPTPAAAEGASLTARPDAAAIGLAISEPTPEPIAAQPPLEAASRPPLDLRWHASPSAAPRAIDLVRSSPGRAGPLDRDERLAQALGTDTALREERRGEVQRFRRGRDCVDTRASRASGLDPFSPSASTRPRLAEPC